MLFDRGYLRVGRYKGAPVRLHWTLPLGAAIFSGGVHPAAWGAFALIILVHELGHAFLVRRYQLTVLSIDLHGLGGHCRYAGYEAPRVREKIAWGGVVAQALLFVAAMLASPLVEKLPPHAAGPAREALEMLLVSNLGLIALNLLPIGSLDGADAWRLFSPKNVRAEWRNMRRRRLHGEARELAEKLEKLRRSTLN